jgi:DNA-3-methyladenine glycosylase II
MAVPAYWSEACQMLAAADPVMAELIAAFPGEGLAQRGDPFATLARAIVSQQISVTAAAAIWARCLALPGGATPAGLMASTFEDLRAAGLSQAKIAYLQDLSQRALDGRLRLADWPSMDDKLVMADLMAIKGIGRWTAEMFLIFSLQRPDVLPVDDIGLQKAMAVHYFADQRPDTQAMLSIAAERWQPWRSVATWYLWRSLDPVAVAY